MSYDSRVRSAKLQRRAVKTAGLNADLLNRDGFVWDERVGPSPFPAGFSAQIDDPRYDPRTRRGFDGTTWDGKKWSLELPAKSGLEFEA